MKIIKDEEFASLKSAAGNWNSIVSKFTEANPEANAEEITPDSLLEAFASGQDETALTAQLQAAQKTVEQQAATIQQLNATVAEQAEKLGAPGATSNPVSKTVDTENAKRDGILLIDAEQAARIDSVKKLYELLPE